MKNLTVVVSYILPLEEGKFVDVSHNVSSDEFFIFVRYDKKGFSTRIQKFVQYIIKEAQKSYLYHYHSNVHRPLVEEAINPPYELFHDSIVITLTTVY